MKQEPIWATAGPGDLSAFRSGSLGSNRGGPLKAVTNGSLGFLMTSPLVNAAKAMQGLGSSDTPNEKEDVVITALRLLFSGALSYQIGKAIAPSSSKESKYAMWAVPIGVVSPYLGLGLMAMYAMNKGK